MRHKTRVFQFNTTSILLEFDATVDESLLGFILNVKEIIWKEKPKQVLQVINTYNSLLVMYKSTINKFYIEKEELLDLVSQVQSSQMTEVELKKIPVCYDQSFGWDLEALSKDLGLSASEIIQKHSAVKYRVYFVGFLPGFPYLGGLDSSLFHRRQAQPRAKIPKGSVGIADQQTGIYPIDSPGGWQIIGRSPIDLWETSQKDHFSFLKAGDQIQFDPISKEEFEYIQSQSIANI
jgi:KipI family sensor histidine kinase inhibitor